MESDVITLSELFKFRIDHVLPDRTVVGGLMSTGLRPTFLDKFERHGISLPTQLFSNGLRAVPEHIRRAEA
jgi:pilus assembly protein CpaF